MSNLRQQGLKQPAVPERYPPAAAAEPGAARRRAGGPPDKAPPRVDGGPLFHGHHDDRLQGLVPGPEPRRPLPGLRPLRQHRPGAGGGVGTPGAPGRDPRPQRLQADPGEAARPGQEVQHHHHRGQPDPHPPGPGGAAPGGGARGRARGRGPGLSVRTLGVAEGRETSTGTVLRSPRQAGATATGKMTSSITITPITSATCRPTQPPPGAASRIPMSRGLKTSAKAGAAVATVTRMESRSEGQLMKIELRRSAGCGPASSSGGKS
ncbi:uncharacterized protein LOC115534829 [Gadus morhua]|uniref:uncharacterized protein LOC115534829 n=1 Tax=Gadus morhua TaxID=8049 RepID=UPI0011B6E367|nr:uncharacterized protein LOC115534829 [Gadus morhua]